MILDNSFYMGGLEKKLFDLALRFDREHFEVVVCCLKEGGYFKESFRKAGIKFYDRLLGFKYDFAAYRKLEAVIKKENIELIYSFLHPNTVIFSFLAKTRGVIKAWVISVHATGSPSGGKLVRRYLKPFLGKADRFIAVAHSHKQYLVTEEGLPEGKIDVIYNGVDLEKYHPGPSSEALRDEFGINDDTLVVTTIASLKPAKRLDILLEAASIVSKSHKDVLFMIIGDGPERENLEDLSRKLGLEDKVVFTGIRDDVYDLLRLSSLFVLSSRKGTETFPNVLLEAMATGVPVVATDVGSVSEMVEDGSSAYVVKPESPRELAGAMDKMLSNPERMRAFGERGRAVVSERFPLEGMHLGREKLFSELLCERSEE